MIPGLLWMIELTNLIIPSVGQRTAELLVDFIECREFFGYRHWTGHHCLLFEIAVQELV
jgi:hypothetical protein